jgi:hypothetical protein
MTPRICAAWKRRADGLGAITPASVAPEAEKRPCRFRPRLTAKNRAARESRAFMFLAAVSVPLAAARRCLFPRAVAARRKRRVAAGPPRNVAELLARAAETRRPLLAVDPAGPRAMSRLRCPRPVCAVYDLRAGLRAFHRVLVPVGACAWSRPPRWWSLTTREAAGRPARRPDARSKVEYLLSLLSSGQWQKAGGASWHRPG